MLDLLLALFFLIVGVSYFIYYQRLKLRILIREVPIKSLRFFKVFSSITGFVVIFSISAVVALVVNVITVAGNYVPASHKTETLDITPLDDSNSYIEHVVNSNALVVKLAKDQSLFRLKDMQKVIYKQSDATSARIVCDITVFKDSPVDVWRNRTVDVKSPPVFVTYTVYAPNLIKEDVDNFSDN